MRGDTLVVAITIDGKPEEIAALAAAMRERQGGDEVSAESLSDAVIRQLNPGTKVFGVSAGAISPF